LKKENELHPYKSPQQDQTKKSRGRIKPTKPIIQNSEYRKTIQRIETQQNTKKQQHWWMMRRVDHYKP
jgi:hypothetical protein